MPVTPPQPRDADEYLLRHVVAICCECEVDGRVAADAFTAFVMQVRERWFLTTAGHVLRTLREHAKSKKATFRLWDCWFDPRPTHHGVPFEFESAPSEFLLEDDEAGIDIGVVELTDHYRRLLESNGIKPFVERTFLNPPDQFDVGFLLVGIPSQFTRRLDGQLEIHPSTISIRQCEAPASMVKPIDRFYAQLAPEVKTEDGRVLETLDGFSGGPIMGFRMVGDRLAYHLVGIQTSWRRRERVLAAVKADSIGRALFLALMERDEGTNVTG